MTGFLDSIKGMFGNSEQKEKTLDKTKKGIEEAKEMMEKEQIPFDKAFEKAIMPRIIEDCNEAGKTQAETREIVQKLRLEIQRELLNETPEKQAIDDFLNDPNTITGFDKIGDAKAAIGPMGAFMEKNGGASQWKLALSQLVEWLRKDDKDSIMASAICFVFKIENKDEQMLRIMEEAETLVTEKKWEEARKKVAEFQKLDPQNTWSANQLEIIKKGEAETPEATTQVEAPVVAAAEKNPEKLTEQQKKYVDLFKKHELVLDPKSVDAGLVKLKTNKIEEIQIDDLMTRAMTDKTGHLKSVVEAVKKAIPGETFSWNLTDLLVQGTTQPKEIVQVIEGTGEYKIEQSSTAIRRFLNEIADEPDTKVVLARYKKTQTSA